MIRRIRWFIIKILAWNDGVLLWKSKKVSLSIITSGDATMKSQGERWI